MPRESSGLEERGRAHVDHPVDEDGSGVSVLLWIAAVWAVLSTVAACFAFALFSMGSRAERLSPRVLRVPARGRRVAPRRIAPRIATRQRRF